jgi:hypothetical protein
MGSVANDPDSKPLQEPVFLDPTGTRWFWFRLFAAAAICICVFGFVSVIVGSSSAPKLPTLDLPFVQRLYAIEPQRSRLAKDDALQTQ